ncbi:MAG TPA: sigma-70 family RNA polymerase sigma factor [Propionicimonas sp.]|nr:sigma-70 family RNA polymerase sigma factor [Propionicimonas sp.]
MNPAAESTGRLPAAADPVEPAQFGELDEKTLLQRSRAGDRDAYAELFRRYRLVAGRIAARTSSTLDPQDVTAEAFARVWSALRRGGGPERAFKPYLAAAVRNVALNWRRGVQELPTEPHLMGEISEAMGETEVAIAEGLLVTAAFATLPERWRHALWVTEVEGRSVAELAAEIGTTANTASALCLRARDGLKLAWLQAHVERRAKNSECAWMLDHLAAHTRGRLPQAQLERAEAHLSACETCEATRRRIAFIGAGLRASILFGGTGAGLLAARAALGITTATAGHAGAVAVVPAVPAVLSSVRSILEGFLSKSWVAQSALGVSGVVIVGAVGFAGFSYATTAHRGTTAQAAATAPASVPARTATTTVTPTPSPSRTLEEPVAPATIPTSRSSKAPATTSPTASAAATATATATATSVPPPTSLPTATPTDTATPTPTFTPTPTVTPTPTDTPTPTGTPMPTPTDTPTPTPTDPPTPTDTPTPVDTPTPTDTPTPSPSPTPSPTQTCYTIIDIPGVELTLCQ